MKIDWERQAKEFLLKHGWKEEKEIGAWFHPIFPLGEVFEEGMAKFCEEFYGDAWKTYISYIQSINLLQEEKQEIGLYEKEAENE